MWGNGSYKLRNLEAGTSEDMSPMVQFCFPMEVRGSARHILSEKDKPRGMEGRGGVLTSRDLAH